MDLVLQALINGLVSGTLLAVPAIGFTAMFAVLRFPNFSVSGIATLGAFAGYVAYGAGLQMVGSLLAAFVVAGAAGPPDAAVEDAGEPAPPAAAGEAARLRRERLAARIGSPASSAASKIGRYSSKGGQPLRGQSTASASRAATSRASSCGNGTAPCGWREASTLACRSRSSCSKATAGRRPPASRSRSNAATG